MLKEANNLRRLDGCQGTVHELPVRGTEQEETELVSLSKAMIADDQPLFRDAIREVVLRIPGCQQVFEASSLKEAVEIVSKHEGLDLAFLDLDMPEMQGLGGLVSLNEMVPSLPIIVMSVRVNRHVAAQVISRGAMGYIAKSASRDEIVSAIRQVLAGKICICVGSGVMEPGGGRAPDRSSPEAAVDPDQFQSLTRRQLLVLERMTFGESNKQIAYNLHIAETTVKAHVSAILRKLNVQNRVQAILAASCLGLVSQMRK